MASYEIRWRKSALKDLKSVRRDRIADIVAAINQLAENPHPSNHKKLAGAERTYRIRVGEYRIIYEVLGEVLLIEVIKVGHRKDVYR
jgi:mRNA interferase RelE/StbE